jgi:predicted metalloprotease with PDZ domain
MRMPLRGRPIALAATLLVARAALVGAQEPPLPRAWAFTWGGHQVRLGVLVNTETDAATDTLGARLEAVTPGGPAGNAGLKAGDVITRFNGVPLARVGGAGDGNPGQRLIDLVRALEPGDSVQVEYRRGGEVRKASLVAEATALGGPVPTDGQGMARVDLPGGFPGFPGLPFLGPGANLSFCFGDAWCDMELVNLNPDLGEYFGTKEGILVIKAPADSSLPLKSGDVLMTIGGRRPTSSAQAMRILGSYEPGETVAIEIMRKQRRTTITWHVPPSNDRMRQFQRFHDVPPDSAEDRSES